MCEVKLDSSKMLMDCHAVQAPLAMTKKGKFLNTPQDFFTRLQIFLSTKSKNTYRILGFLMRNRGFQAIGKGVTLGGNDRRQSRRIHDLSQKDKIPQRLENA